MDEFTISIVLPVTAERLYKAWLDSKEHTAFTIQPANIDPELEGSFSVWDGYIVGENLELQPFSRILQSWRTSDFPEDAEDSMLELSFIETNEGTELMIHHYNLPEGHGPGYEEGWHDYYFVPMEDYFSNL
jgi:activator of HSP90 ATPase